MSERELPVVFSLENGKYTIFEDLNNPAEPKFYAMRYESTWRDLIGDKLALAMVQEIGALRARLNEVISENLELEKKVKEYEYQETMRNLKLDDTQQ